MDSSLAIKVGDFGLARDVYTKDYYRVSSVEAKIPIKWMAPEALYDGISNEKTDMVSVLTTKLILEFIVFSSGSKLEHMAKLQVKAGG